VSGPEKQAADDPVGAYKSILRDLIDLRPSGTRQRIAAALGKHKSFVSQITNPAYSVPVPAKHLATIFDLCHFSPEERRHFLDAYGRAHPGRHLRPTGRGKGNGTRLEIDVPAFKDSRRQAELIETIRTYAESVIALAKKWEQTTETPKK
jgi:hypothetical protein